MEAVAQIGDGSIALRFGFALDPVKFCHELARAAFCAITKFVGDGPRPVLDVGQ